ncbi:hypothetical protein [Rhizosaccharibacter radicis]|uniref:Hemerythrin-like domain-containing protein n=1 Tax=Rhizosaccharibacter radicis TaxID=2782605 RepID=A0ABT1VUT7_9PROT|nr:hypothetical protein [Acetobacteraceae bacterium KSS12]
MSVSPEGAVAEEQRRRSLVADAILLLRDLAASREGEFRRRFLPPLSRSLPRHDPDHLRAAQLLEAAGRELDAASTQLRAAPRLDPARLAGRHGGLASGLLMLAELDDEFERHAGFLRELLGGDADAPWSVADADGLRGHAAFFRDWVRRRADLIGSWG